jgi:hypothetical protein
MMRENAIQVHPPGAEVVVNRSLSLHSRNYAQKFVDSVLEKLAVDSKLQVAGSK